MDFHAEREMTQPAERWLDSLGLMTKREFALPWGVCDLVGCSLSQANVEKRLALGQTRPIGPPLRVMVLTRIPDEETGRGITRRRLAGLFADVCDEDMLDLELTRLTKGRFVRRTPRGSFQRANGWMPLQRRIVAVELKLSRISEALHQAANHLDFAEESYVGLPMDTAFRLANSRRVTQFVRKGVGIVGVARRECTVVLESRRTKSWMNLPVQIHCVERFWRSRPKGS